MLFMFLMLFGALYDLRIRRVFACGRSPYRPRRKSGIRYPHTLLALNQSVSFNSVVLLEHHSFTSADEAS